MPRAVRAGFFKRSGVEMYDGVETYGAMALLAGEPVPDRAGFLIQRAESGAAVAAYRRLRHEEFVVRQQLFAGTDHDDVDDDVRTVVLVAVGSDGEVLGGVRLSPTRSPDIGWWAGGRLTVSARARNSGIGPALIRAACAYAESHGVLRFDANVQSRHARVFAQLGWETLDTNIFRGVRHTRMQWPIHRIRRLANSTKAMLAPVLAPFQGMPGGLGPSAFRGDDGVPVPGSHGMIAACDAIIPSMVERDPEWAGWCSVLVNLNDLAAMGAAPSGLLDAIGAPTTSHLTRIVRGIARAAEAWGVPILGGHTQVGVPASLAVTALGFTNSPVRSGGGRPGDRLRLTADVSGGWRPGHTGRQWDSTSIRRADDLRAMNSLVARMQPVAAKDVSMAGIAGTAGMLAEASGTGVVLDVASVPRPSAADMASWLTCFPGFGMLTVAGEPQPLPAGVTSAECGELVDGEGVHLRWPDGLVTTAVPSSVTGLGAAHVR